MVHAFHDALSTYPIPCFIYRIDKPKTETQHGRLTQRKKIYGKIAYSEYAVVYDVKCEIIYAKFPICFQIKIPLEMAWKWKLTHVSSMLTVQAYHDYRRFIQK